MKTSDKFFRDVTTAGIPASQEVTIYILHPHLFYHTHQSPSCWSPSLDVGTTSETQRGLLAVHPPVLSTSSVIMELKVNPRFRTEDHNLRPHVTKWSTTENKQSLLLRPLPKGLAAIYFPSLLSHKLQHRYGVQPASITWTRT